MVQQGGPAQEKRCSSHSQSRFQGCPRIGVVTGHLAPRNSGLSHGLVGSRVGAVFHSRSETGRMDSASEVSGILDRPTGDGLSKPAPTPISGILRVYLPTRHARQLRTGFGFPMMKFHSEADDSASIVSFELNSDGRLIQDVVKLETHSIAKSIPSSGSTCHHSHPKGELCLRC